MDGCWNGKRVADWRSDLIAAEISDGTLNSKEIILILILFILFILFIFFFWLGLALYRRRFNRTVGSRKCPGQNKSQTPRLLFLDGRKVKSIEKKKLEKNVQKKRKKTEKNTEKCRTLFARPNLFSRCPSSQDWQLQLSQKRIYAFHLEPD